MGGYNENAYWEDEGIDHLYDIKFFKNAHTDVDAFIKPFNYSELKLLA